MTTYKVSLFRYPEEFIIEAKTEQEAINKAKADFKHSVWNSEIERVEDE